MRAALGAPLSLSASNRKPTTNVHPNAIKTSVFSWPADRQRTASESCDIRIASVTTCKCWPRVCAREIESRRDFFFPRAPTSVVPHLSFKANLRANGPDLISSVAVRLSLSVSLAAFFIFFFPARFPKIKILWEYKLPLKQLA